MIAFESTAILFPLDHDGCGPALTRPRRSKILPTSQYVDKRVTGGDTDMTRPRTESDMLDLECESFMRLVRTGKTLERMKSVLSERKKLRN